MKQNKGFTLIELLVVIGVIAILAAIVLVAVNPGRQFANARDTQRRSDLYSITNAVYQYAVEHNGNLPGSFPASATCVGNIAPCYDLSVSLVATYMAEMPYDPSDPDADAADTKYTVYQNTDGRIVAGATGEIIESITIIR
ncbi:type II secretion system GspH family protein [Patescibacteria group bacterium]|nr:type II secretion system GspH family protein [Patescibacteria group bacterium]